MDTGDFVNLYTIDPIEKIWGRLIRISDAGVVVRGFDVKLIESFRYQFHKQEPEVYPQTTFWPMRRVQKVDLDEAIGDIPSVIASLKESTGLEADAIIPLPERAS